MNYTQRRKQRNLHKKIILLHPTKTGGSSIKASLNVLHKHHLTLNSWVIPIDCIVLTTVRNPYDRVMSMYNHFGRTIKKNFDDFVDLVVESNAVVFQPQYKYLHPKSDIIRIESFEIDFNNFCEKYNIKASLYKTNVSKNILVKKINKINKAKIFLKYKKDFEILNYEK